MTAIYMSIDGEQHNTDSNMAALTSFFHYNSFFKKNLKKNIYIHRMFFNRTIDLIGLILTVYGNTSGW